jgi:gamma-tubulin complex component 3
MKPTVSSRFQREGLGGNIGKALEVEQARCHRVRQSMHALISDVQYYVMFEVLEPSWNEFECKLSHNAANDDLDSIIAGHENYMNSVIEKALLGTKSQVLQRSLQLIFDSVQKFKSHTFKLYEAIEDASRVRKSDQRRILEREMNQQGGVDFGESKEGEDYLSEDFVTGAKESLDSIENEFQKHVDGFLKLLPLQTHVDTSFLSFRLEATFRQGA